MTTTKKSLLALVVLSSTAVAACSVDSPDTQPVPDEASIDNVWHKAKLRGVAFRAIGQEPAWLLEITDGVEILLVTDYGSNREKYAYVEPLVFAEERRTRFSVDELEIELRGEPCTDSMSGEKFAVSVTVRQPERTLAGCGRALY